MTEQSNLPVKGSRGFRGRALAGTALALILGGIIAGESVVLSRSPAYAEAVTIANPAGVPSFADVVEQVSPAVVSVRVRTSQPVGVVDRGVPDFPEGSPLERFFREFRGDGEQGGQIQPRARPSMAQGSGFFISGDGYVVTNNHVVDDADDLVVVTSDGREYPARLIGTDDKTDLALIKVEADRDFTYVRFSQDDVRVGDWVVAVGNPFGLGGTVTAGIVSGRGRQIGAGPYDDFLQIDAAVNRGNSGGPAFNLKGEVVGINTAIFSPSGGNIGIAFAIPSGTAENVVTSLRDHGVVVRGWLGVQIQTVNGDIAAALGLTEAGGALVADPQPNSPAAAAGIRAGDAILAVDGQPIADSHELAMRISRYAPNTQVNLTLWRDGAETSLPVTLGAMPGDTQVAALDGGRRLDPPQAPAPAVIDDLGFSLELTPDGAVIADVDPESEAAANGLRPGDVIVAVGTSTVGTPTDVEAKVAEARTAGLKAVLLRVQSGDNTRFVAIPLG